MIRPQSSHVDHWGNRPFGEAVMRATDHDASIVPRLCVPPTGGSSGYRRGPDAQQRGDQLIDLGRSEETVGATRRDVREGRLVQQSRGHNAVFGQVIDDQIDELDLVGAQRLA